MWSKQFSEVVIGLFVILAASVGFLNLAQAQTSVVSTQSSSVSPDIDIANPDSKEAVRAMVAELGDEAVRALLIERLDAVAAANEDTTSKSGGLISILQDRFGKFIGHGQHALVDLPQIPSQLAKARSAIVDSMPFSIGQILILILAAIATGVFAERLFATYLKERKQKLIDSQSTNLWGILKILYTRLAYDVLGVLAFSVGSTFVINQYLEKDNIIQLTANVIPATILGGWMAYVLCRFFFAPRRPDLRICKTSDERAMRITVSFTSEDESERASKSRRTMQQGLLRVGRILVVGFVLYMLASLWGLDLLHLANSGLGAQAAGTLVGFLFILLTAYISWELVNALIGYWLAVEGGSTDDGDDEAAGEIGGVGLSRVATLLPIIRKTALFLIIIVTIVMVLDNWGINTAPILAGAGVVGLAIGFGAQTLVKDIVSGMFFLADDAFRVGEYIDVIYLACASSCSSCIEIQDHITIEWSCLTSKGKSCLYLPICQ